MANKKIPLRKCVACNEMKEKKEMIRVIKTPENEIVLDATGRKNGRGAYICADPECLRLARKLSAPLRLQFRRMCMKVWKRR